MRFLIFSLILVTTSARCQQIVDLFIIEDQVYNGINMMPYFTFNDRDQFDSSNIILRFEPGDEVTFRVTNRAHFTCGFRIASHGQIDAIATNDTEEITVEFNTIGTYLYDDPINDHRALGLGGMLVVSDFNGPEYYGVFAEHEETWVKAITEGDIYDRGDYSPSAYTINGRGFPSTMHDPNSMIMGMVGQTIHIHMTNAGYMYHFPHFHGFHVRILEATQHSHYVGWIKDSFGIAPGESVTLELIPDKPGMYPVHNHNLITTTIGGNYPGGMMMHMHIH